MAWTHIHAPKLNYRFCWLQIAVALVHAWDQLTLRFRSAEKLLQQLQQLVRSISHSPRITHRSCPSWHQMAGLAVEATPQTSLCYLEISVSNRNAKFTEKYSPPAASSSATSCSKTSVKLGCGSSSFCDEISSFLFFVMGSCMAIMYTGFGSTRSRSKKSSCC